MPPGRKSKLTPELQQEIMQVLATGSTQKDACAYVGISEDTFANYMQKSDFSDAVKKAKATARMASVARIRQAGAKGTWQADAWFLERSDPEQWGLKQTIDIPGLSELLKMCKEVGVKPSDIFNAMLQELSSVNSPNDST